MDQLMSLSKIFSEKIFRIPDYQRGYAWTIKEIDDFWSDLCRLENIKNHYVGVLTLEPVKKLEYDRWVDDTWIIEAKRYQPFYVVDGQQRLTTSIILIYTILEIMLVKQIDKLNYTSQDEIGRKYIYEYKDENNSRTYIFGYENDNPSYTYLISKIFNEKTQRSINSEETIYTTNLENAKKYFTDKLKDLSVKKLEEVYTKITQHFLFNMYMISEDIDVFVTFETMNNRGKALSNLELLKNRLIYVSTLFNCHESDKLRLRRDINSCWKNIYHILGKNKEKKLLDDEFLVTHFMLYFCKSVKELEEQQPGYLRDFGDWQCNHLLNQYFVPANITENKLVIKDCFDYIDSLRDCILLWDKIKNPRISDIGEEIKDYIEKINYLSLPYRGFYNYHHQHDFSYINVFILACFKACKNSNDLLKFVKSFEKYLFATEFYDGEAIEEIDINILSFPDITIKLNTGDMVIQGVIDKLDKVYSYMISSVELNRRTIRYYNRNGFYRKYWVRYFLCEYELNLMKKSKSQINKMDKNVFLENGFNSIEHIYPENSHYKYWMDLYRDFTPKQRDSLKNSLGNFVAISKQKNSKLGNMPFPDKKSNSQNKIGYKYGTYAEIELTEYDDWSANEILNRGFKLLLFLNERWGIKIGNGKKEDKKQFLGLDFMH